MYHLITLATNEVYNIEINSELITIAERLIPVKIDIKILFGCHLLVSKVGNKSTFIISFIKKNTRQVINIPGYSSFQKLV